MSKQITIEVPDEVHAWLAERAQENLSTAGDMAAVVLTEALVEGHGDGGTGNPCDIEVNYHTGGCFWCRYSSLKESAA